MIYILFILIIIILIVIISRKNILIRELHNEVAISKFFSDKHLSLFLVMNRWIRVKQEDKKVAEYLRDNGYKTIAIYGLSYIGMSLLYDLRNSEIEVKYGIDNAIKKIRQGELNIYSAEEELPNVDAIIVTSIFHFKEIKDTLCNKVPYEVISLEDILYEL